MILIINKRKTVYNVLLWPVIIRQFRNLTLSCDRDRKFEKKTFFSSHRCLFSDELKKIKTFYTKVFIYKFIITVKVST